MTTTPTVSTASSAPTPSSPPSSPGHRLRAMLQGNFRQYGMVAALAVIVILFQVWTDGILLKPLNVTNIVQQNGYILVLAIGMVIVIISGHIDLSVGSIAGFVGAMSAVLMIKNDMPWPVAVALCLLLGALIGAWQGFWIAYVGIPSFIVTLAGMLVFRGATQYLLEGQSIAPFPRSFGQVSSGFLPELGGNSLYHWPTVIIGVLVMVAAVWQQVRQRRAQARYGFDVSPTGWFLTKNTAIIAALAAFTLLLASYRGVPVVGIILALAFVAYAFIMRSTVF